MITLPGRYEIERELGHGGMATVYLARDVRHARRVALKVMKPELGAVLGAERFLAEIRVTANLQHPNILPLFDSGEAEGHLYYVMPYVAGESLRQKLEREKQLPIPDALHVAVSIGAALDYAHRHGVIHRDLKPENILLLDGQPLIADFGIALAVSNAGGPRVTQTGLSLGTPQYMSPEQAAGDRTVDGRSDIYSLGAVLYETLAGEPPHMGNTVQAIVAKVLTETPVSVRERRPSVPEHVAGAIARALEKVPADRWGTGQDFATALQQTSAPSTRSHAPHLATTRSASGIGSRRTWLWAAATVALVGTSWWVSAAVHDSAPPLPTVPVVIMMDSPHPQRVYDPATLRAGGTNADDLTERLRDEPLVLIKETTGARWDREDQVLSQHPDVILAHRSSFYDATLLGDSILDRRYAPQIYPWASDKFEAFMGYVARANPHTQFVIYSRGSWATDSAAQAWVTAVEHRFPAIAGRLTAYKVPLTRATFRNDSTAAEIKTLTLDALRKAGRLPPAGAAR
jgi:serine/threonine protein kinase